jgi:hypothetical protein
VDTTAPRVQTPTVEAVARQALRSTVAVHVAWPVASDPSGISSYQLESRKGTGAWTPIALGSPTALAADVTISVATRYTFRLRAIDGANNVGAWVTTRAAKLALIQETPSAVLTYSGQFARDSVSGASGGSVRWASARAASAKLRFTGSSVSFVTTLAQARGSADVWIDGSKVDTIDLYSASTSAAQIAWSTHLSRGNHVLEIRLTGAKNPAASSSRVDVDAFLVWR